MSVFANLKSNYEKFKVFEFVLECIELQKEEYRNPTENFTKVNSLVSNAVEILMSYLQNMFMQSSNYFDNDETKQKQFGEFIGKLVEFMLDTKDIALKYHLYEFMKSLLENELNSMFYLNSIQVLAVFLSRPLPDKDIDDFIQS